jgi:LmbE family N-acetylglucosaminyl deacetylase
MTTVFLLAHQDDEIGVFQAVRDSLAQGERTICVFMTDGVWGGVTADRRNKESSIVLRRLGVTPDNIVFLGSQHGLANGRLVEVLDRALEHLRTLIAGLGDVDRIVMHAWEGGHQDHDAVHLLGLAIAAETSLLDACRQFPLYRAPVGRWLTAFAQPLRTNGPVERQPIALRDRIWYIALLCHYRSQWRVMAKLGPVLLWDYLVDGCQKLQPVSLARIREHPHPGITPYEIWKLYDYGRFRQHADSFIAAHLASASVTVNETGSGNSLRS